MSPSFSVIAIIAAFNEADIIAQVVADLISQGIHVYFLDDGSTDRTVAEVEPYIGRGVLAIERRAVAAAGGAPGRFEWEQILLRKTQLARELDADWFIHHDADEFRESPWPRLTLKEAIQHVDALGYNAIDFTSLDFWPTHDRFVAGDDVRAAFQFYSEPAPYDRIQIRCWKKADDLDLASSGGHEAQFGGRSVFPVRFILRHYPIRGQNHGVRKVFEERRNRFLLHERARGWHVQYDGARVDVPFIRDVSTLMPYEAEAVRLSMTLRHRGVEALEALFASVQTTVHQQRTEIERCIAEIDRQVTQLAERDKEIGRRNIELSGARDENGLARAEISRARDETDLARAEIRRLRAELDAQRVEAAALHRELASMQAARDTHIGELACLRDGFQHRGGDIERLRRTAEERTRLVEELHHSLSWRWTAPLRAIARMVRLR
jgi:hypothetical protein